MKIILLIFLTIISAQALAESLCVISEERQKQWNEKYLKLVDFDIRESGMKDNLVVVVTPPAEIEGNKLRSAGIVGGDENASDFWILLAFFEEEGMKKTGFVMKKGLTDYVTLTLSYAECGVTLTKVLKI